MPAKPVPVGNGFLLATSEDFLNGYLAGHLAYMAQWRSMQCSDEQVTALFLEKLEDIDYSSLYGIGYVVGWLHTLASKGTKNNAYPVTPSPASHEAHTGEGE